MPVSSGKDKSVQAPYGERVARVERVTDPVMLVLSVVYVVAFVIGYLPEIDPLLRDDALLAENAIVVIFALELGVRVAAAERRLAYLKACWLDVVIILLPFLRPLRPFVALLRVIPMVSRGVRGLQHVLGRYQGAYVLVLGAVTILLGTGLVLIFERDSGGSIESFGDALWWAMTTITTVGYGDTYPVTPGGRSVAVVLMAVGIAVFGVLTAGIAAYFVGEDESEGQSVQLERVLQKLDSLERRVEELDRKLENKEEAGDRSTGGRRREP